MLCGMRGRFGGVGIDSVFGLGWFGWSWVELIDRGDDSDLGFWDLFFCSLVHSLGFANVGEWKGGKPSSYAVDNTGAEIGKRFFSNIKRLRDSRSIHQYQDIYTYNSLTIPHHHQSV
jgi:hypothetical protein